MRIQDQFIGMTYEQAERQWPGLTERIFEAATRLTPRQLTFEIEEIGLPYCMVNEVDQDTYTVISTVLSRAIDEPHILLTQGDVLYAYYRFAHLIWLYEIVRQGIYVEKMDENGNLFYEMARKPTQPRYKPQTKFITPNFVSLFWK